MLRLLLPLLLPLPVWLLPLLLRLLLLHRLLVAVLPPSRQAAPHAARGLGFRAREPLTQWTSKFARPASALAATAWAIAVNAARASRLRSFQPDLGRLEKMSFQFSRITLGRLKLRPANEHLPQGNYAPDPGPVRITEIIN